MLRLIRVVKLATTPVHLVRVSGLPPDWVHSSVFGVTLLHGTFLNALMHHCIEAAGGPQALLEVQYGSLSKALTLHFLYRKDAPLHLIEAVLIIWQ